MDDDTDISESDFRCTVVHSRVRFALHYIMLLIFSFKEKMYLD